MIKKHAKDIIILLVLAIVFTVAFTCMDIKTVEEYYSEPLEENKKESIYLSIDCKTITTRIEYNRTVSLEKQKPIRQSILQFIPPKGIILSKAQFAIKEGDTVFSIFKRVTAHNKIPISYKEQIGGGVYLEGINHIFEKDCKGTSGWVYLVNGKMPGVDMANYMAKPGDIIQIRYTCEYGDIGRKENEI